jgi:hypothetical protein
VHTASKQGKLEIARRRVREAEESLVRQTAAIGKLKARGAPTEDARRALRVHIGFLQVARHHLAIAEAQEDDQKEGSSSAATGRVAVLVRQ